MPGPFGKDISYSQKVGGPERKRGFNFLRIFAIAINLIGSYFCFRVNSPLVPKFCVFLISMIALFLVFLLEDPQESENPQTKSRSEYKTEHRKDDGTKASLIVLLTSTNIFNISEEILINDIILATFFTFLLSSFYVYLSRFANRKRKKWRNRR